MLRRRFFFRHLDTRDDPSSRVRIRRGTCDGKNLNSSTFGSDFVDGRKSKLKRGRRSVDSERGVVRKKRRIGENVGVCDGNPPVDRISELPEAIIHHILSYLRCPKDVVRMSILSTRWKSLFDSYPLFDFDERCFHVKWGKGKHNRLKAREIQRKKFKSYVEKSLALKLDSVPSVDRFRLYVTNTSMKMQTSMRQWFDSVLKKNVKELDICYAVKDQPFVFPSKVLKTTSVTSLKLSGSILYSFSDTTLSNLRTLSIKDTVLMMNSVIKKFEEGCPMLEDLRLVRCPALSSLTISSLLKLRRVEVHKCTKLESIEIKAETLETFCYYAEGSQLCHLNLKGSQNLRNLTLRTWAMTDNVFQRYMFWAPCLEKLVLLHCNNLEKITILSWRLKSLALIQCTNLNEVRIDAPNLYSFEYCGHRMPFSSMNVLGLCRAKLSFGPSMKTSQGIVEYRKLFGTFDHHKNFKLIIYSKQNMKIYEEPREAQLVPPFFRKLELTQSLTGVLNTVDNWLRECRGRNLLLMAPSSELTKMIHSLIYDTGKNPNCCGIYSNKCWRHYLADVKTPSSNRSRKICYEFRWVETK